MTTERPTPITDALLRLQATIEEADERLKTCDPHSPLFSVRVEATNVERATNDDIVRAARDLIATVHGLPQEATT